MAPQNPTISSLAAHLERTPQTQGEVETFAVAPEAASHRNIEKRHEVGLAVVGMAGRFPSTPDLKSFWEVLKSGRDTLRRFTNEELMAKNIPAEVFGHPDFVLAGQVTCNPFLSVAPNGLVH